MFFEIKSNVSDYFHSGKLPVLLDSIGSCDYQTHMIRQDGYRSHHFIWVDEGEGVFKFGNQTIVLKPGQGVFIRAGFPHEYHAGKDNIFASSWVTFYGADNLLEHYGAGDWFQFSVNDLLLRNVRTLYSRCVGNGNVFSRSSATYSLVIEFLGDYFAKSTVLTQKVDQYLETHFAEDISLDDVALAVMLNKYTLCKQYREISECTIVERLKEIRCAKAKQYLLNTSYSVEHIGKMCGFKSPSYFGKVFLEATGITPRGYRVRHKV
ncbi:MAG: helix-turn-helix domain-containing protein [Clostridia bacterium]|nr:helix-turn-helix domain-containing protein [Clostridia bacterium]